MKVLILKSGHEVLLDDEWFIMLSVCEWRVDHELYVTKNVGNSRTNSMRLRMHRVITSCPKHLMVDHVNGNTLDNREANLRICTNTQNQWNSIVKKSSKSLHKGVTWNDTDKVWIARISVNRKRIHLGRFKNEEEAAIVYEEASKFYHTDYSIFNRQECLI